MPDLSKANCSDLAEEVAAHLSTVYGVAISPVQVSGEIAFVPLGEGDTKFIMITTRQ